MPVSRTTIVFAIVACIPFGLAIRDTLGGEPRRRGDDHGEFAAAESRRARIEAELAAAESRRETARAEAELAEQQVAEKALQKTRRLRVFEARRPATLGPALDGVALGDRDVEGARRRASALDAGLTIEVLGEREVETVVMKPDASLSCTQLLEELVDRWGPGDGGDAVRRWIDVSLGRRAILSVAGCELRFEKQAPPEAWIDKSSKTAIVPMWAIGRSSAELARQLGERGIADLDTSIANELSWTDIGLGAGWGRTTLAAHAVKGRIVAVTAFAEVERSTAEQTLAHLAARLGKGRPGEAATWVMAKGQQLPGAPNETMTWTRSKPPVVAELDGARLFVTVGTVPE